MEVPQKHEKFQASLPFRPFPSRILRRKEEVLNEMRSPCSRFRPAFSSEENFDLRLSQLASRLDVFASESLLLAPGVPLNWQLLVDYLHEMGVTASSSFAFQDMRTDGPKMFSVRLSPAETGVETDGRSVSRHGFASGASLEESMSKTVGEILERYFLTLYKREKLHFSSYADVLGHRKYALDPTTLNDFLPSQKETFAQFKRDATKELYWVRGKELTSGRAAYIPAQLIFWSYRIVPGSGEPVLAQPTTNGGAGHFTREEALLASLLESIQRDGFLIYWLNSLSPHVIDTSTIVDPSVTELLQYLRRYGFEYYFLNTTTDMGIPSCTCVLLDPRMNDPVVMVGGAAGFSFKELIFQSVGEALATYRYIASADQYRFPDDYSPFKNPAIGRNERLRIWKGMEMYERMKFFIQGSRQNAEAFMAAVPSLDTATSRLAYILNTCKQLGKGYEVYAYEVEHNILRKLGYHVVKTVVPRLMSLYLNEHMATLDAPRLREVPQKLGHEAAEVYNPWPHPFP